MSLLMTRVASHLTMLVLVVLATAGLLVQTGSLPHVHIGDGEAGLYNEEHDLTLLASLAAHGTLADAAPTFTIDAVADPVTPFAPERPALRLQRAGASRAPPVR